MADRALLVGINNYPYVNPLRGCLNDLEGMTALLTGTFGFPAGSIRTLRDSEATKDRIVSEVTNWLFQGATPGDRLVFHFSGHGSQISDPNDPTGDDELLCLYDIQADLANPQAYLTDKELGKLFSSIPDGVSFVAVFDSCHSGTGTRELAPAVSEALGFRPGTRPRVLEKSPVLTVSQAREIGSFAFHAAHAESAQTFVRYLPPPPEKLPLSGSRGFLAGRRQSFAQRVMNRAMAARHATALATFNPRQLVQAEELNYVFYAACRADQTAADASIGGASHGAFTYYLTKILSSLGAAADRKALDDQVTANLVPYQQDPQLESASSTGPILSLPGAVPAPPPAPAPVTTTGAAGPVAFPTEALRNLGVGLSQLLAWAEQGGAAGGRPVRRGGASKVLVTVHGIGNHQPGYSDPWWNALSPYAASVKPGNRGAERQEVVWSQVVHARGLTRAAVQRQGSDLAEQIAAVLRDRADRDLDSTQAPPAAAGAGGPARALDPRRAIVAQSRSRRDFSIQDLGNINDFLSYMLDPSIRSQVLDCFFRVVRPLLQAGTEIEIISHSWGTVVAYEGLLELERLGGITGSVHNLFTVGAALSIWPVKKVLMPEAQTGRLPSMVGRWVNLDARFDVVGGHLQGDPYQVSEEFLNLDPVGCTPSWLPQPACAHSSYFRADNLTVNRDIFGAFIES